MPLKPCVNATLTLGKAVHCSCVIVYNKPVILWLSGIIN